MTLPEVQNLKPGQFVQETLNSRFSRKRAYGRPREVIEVVKRWEYKNQLLACVHVRFGSSHLIWVIKSGDESYKLAQKPTEDELIAWARRAELNPEIFD